MRLIIRKTIDFYYAYVASILALLTFFTLGGIWILPLLLFQYHHPIIGVIIYLIMAPSLYIMMSSKE